MKRHGIGHRFGAVGKTGSIAIIERFWKTLKQQLSLRLFPPLVLDELHRRVEQGLCHYAFYRPHQGLGGKTPAELFFGHENTPLTLLPPPRGQPGQLAGECPFRIDYLDDQRRLPILNEAA